jgi:hypothetical protein
MIRNGDSGVSRGAGAPRSGDATGESPQAADNGRHEPPMSFVEAATVASRSRPPE